jgi:hypothetical protein
MGANILGSYLLDNNCKHRHVPTDTPSNKAK